VRRRGGSAAEAVGDRTGVAAMGFRRRTHEQGKIGGESPDGWGPHREQLPLPVGHIGILGPLGSGTQRGG
jgi:hypothetical protein